MISYVDRVNLSHALIPMSKDLGLTTTQQGILLSSFSWGYVAFMGIGGWLVDRIGPVAASVTAGSLWSLATAAMGIAWGFQSALFSRIAVGVGEAPLFPAAARMVRDNFPIEERGRATALFDAGSYVGIAISAPIVVFIMVAYGWRISFIACATLGLGWAAIFLFFTRRLSHGEAGEMAISNTPPSFSEVKRLLTNRKVLGASYGFFCYNYSKSFFLTWFPAYLVSERGFTFLSVGIVAMLPAMAAIAGEIFAGTLTDRLIKQNVSVTVARKLPICAGMVLASTIALTGMVSSQWAVVAVLSFAFASTIAASPGIWAIPGDIAPSRTYVGTIGGIQNTFSNIAGIVAPIVTGLIVARTGSFGAALTVSAVIAISGALSYWFLVGELEPLWKGELSDEQWRGKSLSIEGAVAS
jgi:MFS family permease